jgi:hypothetical protein
VNELDLMLNRCKERYGTLVAERNEANVSIKWAIEELVKLGLTRKQIYYYVDRIYECDVPIVIAEHDCVNRSLVIPFKKFTLDDYRFDR